MAQYRATVRIEVTDDAGNIRTAIEQYARHVCPGEGARLRQDAEVAIAEAVSTALDRLCPVAMPSLVVLPDTALQPA